MERIDNNRSGARTKRSTLSERKLREDFIHASDSHRNFGVSRKHSSNSIKGFILYYPLSREFSSAVSSDELQSWNSSVHYFPIKQHDHLETLFNIDPLRIRWEQQSSPLFCQTEYRLKLYPSHAGQCLPVLATSRSERTSREAKYIDSREIHLVGFLHSTRHSARYFIFFRIVRSSLSFYLRETIVRRGCHYLVNVPFFFSRYKTVLMYCTLAHFGRQTWVEKAVRYL